MNHDHAHSPQPAQQPDRHSVLATRVMLPILLVMHARLAITEEAEMRKRFGAEFEAYAASTPRFLPSWRTGTKLPAH